MVLLTRQPHFLQASSSNPSSSNHHHVAPDSPQRPSRTSRGGGNYYEPTTPRLNDLDRRTRTESSHPHRDNSRPRSLQSGGGGSPDSLYELLEVPVGCDSTPKVQVKEAAKRKTTTNKKKPSYSSSSSSSKIPSKFSFQTSIQRCRLIKLVTFMSPKTLSSDVVFQIFIKRVFCKKKHFLAKRRPKKIGNICVQLLYESRPIEPVRGSEL